MNKVQDDFLEDLDTSKEKIAGAYFLRFVAPWVMFAPMFIFNAFTLGALLATIVGFKIANRSIEHIFHREFAAAYMLRDINLTIKEENRNG